MGVNVLWVKLAIGMILITSLFFGGWFLGGKSVQKEWDIYKLELTQAHADEVLRLEQLSRKVEVRYMDRVVPVIQRGEERIKYVTKYVTKEADAKCDVSAGFVELHNAAAEDRLPNASASTEFDEGVTPPKLSDVGQTVVNNYNKFHETRIQCEALQEWAKEISNVQVP